MHARPPRRPGRRPARARTAAKAGQGTSPHSEKADQAIVNTNKMLREHANAGILQMRVAAESNSTEAWRCECRLRVRYLPANSA